ncbi:MAG: tetratricopeptide repeat protein [Acidobacteria bacterium]|nr:tetratricopeptide repeat protein [Acidobacteriota bacterium]
MRRLALLAGPALAILIYLPTLGHQFVFDDRGAIQANPLLQDVRDLPRVLVAPYWMATRDGGNLYRPITTFSFALDRLIARGLRPGWFHFVNLLLHGLATWLVVRLVVRFVPGTAGPAMAGVIFALHPVHVEAVAGVVGRSEMLAACGVLTAILCHRRALLAGTGEGRGWLAAAWSAALLAMLAKESGIIAPALCLLFEIAVPSLRSVDRDRRRVLYAGHAAAVVVYLVARVCVLGGIGIGAPIHFVDNPAAASGFLGGRFTALSVLPRYAQLLLWPTHLSADYSYAQIPVVEGAFNAGVLGGFALVVLLVVGGAGLVRRAPAVGTGLLWIAVSAALTTNLLFFVGTLLAERLMYLPSVGLCLLLAWGVASARRRLFPIVLGLVLLAGAAGAVRSADRIADWRDDLTLYGSSARVSPRSVRIRYNLGNAYLRRGEWIRAEENYHAALGIYPDFDDARMNLGMAVLQQGRARESMEHFRAVLDRDPAEVEAKVNLASAHQALGEEAMAESLLMEVVRESPHSAKAWNNLGSLAMEQGEVEVAIGHLEAAVERDPGMAIFRVNLADALTAAGRYRDAADQFEAAYRLDPFYPEVRRGWGERALNLGDEQVAVREFRAAASGRPPSARAANFLGFILARRGDLAGAVEAYEEAIRIDPSLHDVHNSLALIHAEQPGEPARAIMHLLRSLELDPRQEGAEEIRRRIDDLKEGMGAGD